MPLEYRTEHSLLRQKLSLLHLLQSRRCGKPRPRGLCMGQTGRFGFCCCLCGQIIFPVWIAFLIHHNGAMEGTIIPRGLIEEHLTMDFMTGKDSLG